MSPPPPTLPSRRPPTRIPNAPALAPSHSLRLSALRGHPDCNLYTVQAQQIESPPRAAARPNNWPHTPSSPRHHPPRRHHTPHPTPAAAVAAAATAAVAAATESSPRGAARLPLAMCLTLSPPPLRRHLDGISMVSRWYLEGISMVSRWHLDGISVASRWHLGDISVASRWHLGGISVSSRRHLGGISMASR